MNPDQIAQRIRRLLDASADNLPPHIHARLEAARGQALSRLDARRPDTAAPTHARRPAAAYGPQPDAAAQGRPRAGSVGAAAGAAGSGTGWATWLNWAGWPAWARLGLATVPVVLVATLLALPALDPAAPDGTLSAGNTSPSAAQQVANGQTPDAPATPGQHQADNAQAVITAQAPEPAAEASEALETPANPEPAALAAATTPASPLTAQQEAEPALIVYRHAFTRPPDMSIPVVFPQAGGFARAGFGTPVSFTLPMTPNPTPPLSSLDLPPP
ncbi:MAG: DUF3619 family protein [Lautropia sp.]|nr:DUF3619 family protein [Lautropia sp.]